MLRLRILISACVGTFIYVAVSIIGGQDGIIAYIHMKEQRQLLSVNTAEMERLHTHLQEQYTALLQDPDAIASYARKLGYVHENEKLVRIAGMLPLEEPVYDAGTIVHAEKGSYIPEWLCKVLAIICGALSLIILSAVSRIPRTGRTAAVQQDTQTAQVQSVYSAGIALHTRQ